MKAFSNREDFLSLLTDFELNRPKNEVALSLFVESLNKGVNIYKSAVASVAISLNWRWAGLGKYQPNSRMVDVLAWWDGNSLSDTFSYKVARTPCENIILDDAKEFININNIRRNFPSDQLIRSIGATCYSGYTFSNRKGELFGHLFSMDDNMSEDKFGTFDILSPIVTLLSHEIDIQTQSEPSPLI